MCANDDNDDDDDAGDVDGNGDWMASWSDRWTGHKRLWDFFAGIFMWPPHVAHISCTHFRNCVCARKTHKSDGRTDRKIPFKHKTASMRSVIVPE